MTRPQTRRGGLGARIRASRFTSSPALLCAGSVALVVGVFLPWIRGLTKFHGFIDWNGASEEGDGLIVVCLAILILAFVRWRTGLEEMEPRSRWIPLVLAFVAGLIWLIAFRKAAALMYEGPDGARLQIGLLVIAVGVVLAVAGGWLVANDPNRRRAPVAPRRRGGRDPATGAEYSVRERVDPTRPPDPD